MLIIKFREPSRSLHGMSEHFHCRTVGILSRIAWNDKPSCLHSHSLGLWAQGSRQLRGHPPGRCTLSARFPESCPLPTREVSPNPAQRGRPQVYSDVEARPPSCPTASPLACRELKTVRYISKREYVRRQKEGTRPPCSRKMPPLLPQTAQRHSLTAL